MKAVLSTTLIGATLLLMPWLSFSEGEAVEAGEDRFQRDLSRGDVFTCDDFSGCPEGWSLVSSPSLVECSQKCTQERCCALDQTVEVMNMQEIERRLAVNDTNANTTTTVTTTMTTTFLANAETTISGALVLDVQGGSATDFAGDIQAQEAMEETIADKTNVPKSWVKVEISATSPATRRLSQGSAHLRRLASVTATYTITIPPNVPTSGLGSGVTAASVSSAITGTTETALTDAVVSKLVEKGVTAFTVMVSSISTPNVIVATITTTTTKEALLDSLALTKAAFAPAHALALLAVILSALSS